MFSTVLIADRALAAIRIARTAKRLGLRTVAVASAADPGAERGPVRAGDAAYEAEDLSIDTLMAIARTVGADCIHPGRGPLADDPAFAAACQRAGVALIGAPPDVLAAIGARDRVKLLMEEAGLPVVPGYHGERQETAFLRRKGYEIGYPSIIQAITGGVARRVERHADFEEVLEQVRRDALAAGGDRRVLIETLIPAARRFDVTVLADSHGHVIHLHEREILVVAGAGTMIAGAPAAGLPAELRAIMGGAAIEAVRAAGLVGVATVSFLADGTNGLHPDAFWFAGVKAGLQVEHAVTESITGLDPVEWQFRIAAGEPLSVAQRNVGLVGHALAAWIRAEDPAHDFRPSAGEVVALDLPIGEGVQAEAGAGRGDVLTAASDTLLAEVVAHAPSRADAIERLAAALEATLIAGPAHTAGVLSGLVRAVAIRDGPLDRDDLVRAIGALGASGSDAGAIAAGAARLVAREQGRIAALYVREDDASSPWDAVDGFQLTGPRRQRLSVCTEDGAASAAIGYGADGVSVEVDGVAAATAARTIDGADGIVYVIHRGRQTTVRLSEFP